MSGESLPVMTLAGSGNKGITVADSPDGIYQMKVGYRIGDMLAPNLDGTEALRAEVLHLAECMSTGRAPLADGLAGLRVVAVLEAASQSVREKGKLVKLTPMETL